jgi:hypothetical protein
MTTGSIDDRSVYVIGPVWHIVDGQGADAPHQGRIYPLRCYRWITVREAEERGIHRGNPPPDAPICAQCLTFRTRSTEGAFEESDD